mmetsp:Transcript_8166/g.10416  ORF Transcript_8166/g.10416 Transcript_8166/m.10416 type:complete len:520 (-) Transcript_8166:229-1788(-)
MPRRLNLIRFFITTTFLLVGYFQKKEDNLVLAYSFVDRNKKLYDLRQTNRNWYPEKKFVLDDDDSSGTWHEMVSLELNRSVQIFNNIKSEDEAIIQLERLLNCSEIVILVIEERLFVSLDHYSIMKHKPQKHFEMILSIPALLSTKYTEFSPRLPNAVYLFHAQATGRLESLRCDSVISRSKDSSKNYFLPFVVIAKDSGYEMPGILIPNPYFQNLTVWNELNQFLLARAKREHPWENRDPRCIWRGTVNSKTKCHDDFGNWARFCALVRSNERPDLLDIKAVGLLQPTEPENNAMHLDKKDQICKAALPYDSGMKTAYYNIIKNNAKRSQFFAHYLSFLNYTKYQFILNLPGVQGGSYSRNLNKIWNMNSVIALWNSLHVEWYYPALRHGHTHIGVDCHNIIKELEYFKSDPRKLNRLRQTAQRVYNEFLSAESIALYMIQVLNALSQRSGQYLILEDRLIRNRVLKQLNCPRFDLVEIKTSGHFSEIDSIQEEFNNTTKYKLKLISRDDPVLASCAQ